MVVAVPVPGDEGSEHLSPPRLSSGVHRLPVVHLLHCHRADVQHALRDHALPVVIRDTVKDPRPLSQAPLPSGPTVQSLALVTLSMFSHSHDATVHLLKFAVFPWVP